MNRIAICLGLLCLLVPALPVHAEKPAKLAKAVMQRYEGKDPGAALLVLQNGKPVLKRAEGRANLEDGDKITSATNFRLGTLSEAFTAVAVLRLADTRGVTLDDSVRRWLPNLPATTQPITLRHLLDHSSGLPGLDQLAAPAAAATLSDQDVLARLGALSALDFAPGSRYRHTRTDYVLLGLVIERASGMSLPVYLDLFVFQPLGMNNTQLHEPQRGSQVSRRALGYAGSPGQWSLIGEDGTRGDGGVYSNIDDLAKWESALHGNQLLDATARTALISRQIAVGGDPGQDGEGYGWHIAGNLVWQEERGHGFHHVIIQWPDAQLTVILLSNRASDDVRADALAIGQAYLAE